MIFHESQAECVRISLGTVQFGLNYGVANSGGQVKSEEVIRILALARKAGLDTLDTAISYGSSEDVLGSSGVDGWKVISKLPGLPESCPDVGSWVQNQIDKSLSRLGIAQLQGILLHRPEQLLGANGKACLMALETAKNEGKINKIGVSIYNPDELNDLLLIARFDIVQAPLNILDNRIVSSGWAHRLDAEGIELHARSIFLQGLLLMPPEKRSKFFDRWNSVWRVWSEWLDDTGLNPLQACLSYALSFASVNRILVGVDSAVQLQEILAVAEVALPSLPDWPKPIDPVLVNPALWKVL